MRRVELWALAGLALTACGDDEKPAVQKCKNLINTFCDRVRSCAVEGDILAEDYAPAELESDCKEAVGEELPCDDADDINDNYSQCLSDLETFSCDVSNDALNNSRFANPPDSCIDAILYIK